MNKKFPWHNSHVNPFTNFDAFHCMEEEKAACDFCPHCGLDERFEISGHFGRNSILRAFPWHSRMPKVRKNYEQCKGVVL